MRVNNSTIATRSTEQKQNTKSSCEAELVGVSEHIGEVLKIKNFLEDIGLEVKSPTLFQDNQSTIALIKRGRPASNQTKHIAIKFFFVSDLLNQQTINIEFSQSENMLADILTKPLQGNQFVKLRDMILGLWIEGSVADVADYHTNSQQQSITQSSSST